jgi:plastocyanin
VRHSQERAAAKLAALIATSVLAAPALGAEFDWSKAQIVTVITVEYAFEPNHLVFRPDVAYRLYLENHGHELHELTAPDFFKAVELRNPEALTPERTEIVLQPREQKDIFFVARSPGTYKVWCADHDWAGMTGDILVK